jgi:hypothetical protein
MCLLSLRVLCEILPTFAIFAVYTFNNQSNKIT